MSELAPIVLFVYNRPWHTRQTLEALTKNDLAIQSTLLIYADGPKANATPDQLNSIAEVRQVIREKQWCKEVIIIESSVNYGVDDSVIHGVTETINKYSKVIVLEDDLITSVGFLKYMNDALILYEDEPKIMGISGYNFPIKANKESTFFIKSSNAWGWATWKRAWTFFNPNAGLLYDEIIKDNKTIAKFNFNNSIKYSEMLKNCYQKIDKPWDIRWYASIFLKNGFYLFPYKSLIQNIGWDNSGTHCGDFNYYKTKMVDRIDVTKISLSESFINRRRIENFFHKMNNPSIIMKIIQKIFR
jgi:hypothetical protein